MEPSGENSLLEQGFATLRDLLADGTGVELAHYFDGEREGGADAWWQVRGDGHSYGTIMVEAFNRFSPRSLDRMRWLDASRIRQMDDPIVLVLAPWLHVRSQALIAERGWSYLDLSGNVLIRSRRPPLYVRLAGATTDPFPRERGEVQLRGSAVNALVRVLVDVEPPYRMVDLAAATGLSKGYVSRGLTTLHDKGLIERRGSGPVTDVRWVDLLRHRAAEYDLLNSNQSRGFIARSGPGRIIESLAHDGGTVVTGSFAAAKVNPIAAPAQLVLYVEDIDEFAKRHQLMAAVNAANILLLKPSSLSQVHRTRLVDGVAHAGYSQLAMDLLAGNGRLPEEGEAVIQWMIDTPGWRLPNLAAIGN